MLALRDLGLQLQIRLCHLDGPLGHPMLEGLAQPAQFSLRPLLQPEVTADGRNIHRLSGARIVAAEPLHKERGLPTPPPARITIAHTSSRRRARSSGNTKSRICARRASSMPASPTSRSPAGLTYCGTPSRSATPMKSEERSISA